MTPVLAPGDQTFRVGSALNDSFRVLAANPVPFFLAPALAISPVFLGIAIALRGGAHDPSPIEIFLLIVAAFYILAMFVVVRGAVIYGTFRYLQGRRVTASGNFRMGLHFFWRTIRVGFVSELLISLGYSFFFIPGLYLATIYWVAVPVALVESKGVGESLRRSSMLADGSRWKILGLVFIWAVATFFFENGPGLLIDFSGFHPAAILATWVMFSLSMTLGGILGAVSYYQLRRLREGIGIEQIAAVFD